MSVQGYCYLLGNRGCDVTWSVEPITALGFAFAGTFAALGFFALVYMLARKP